MKFVKRLLIISAAAGLLAGCATNENQGAPPPNVGTQTGGGEYSPNPPTPRAVQRPTGPNGSIGSGNPFGLSPGNTDNF